MGLLKGGVQRRTWGPAAVHKAHGQSEGTSGLGALESDSPQAEMLNRAGAGISASTQGIPAAGWLEAVTIRLSKAKA